MFVLVGSSVLALLGRQITSESHVLASITTTEHYQWWAAASVTISEACCEIGLMSYKPTTQPKKQRCLRDCPFLDNVDAHNIARVSIRTSCLAFGAPGNVKLYYGWYMGLLAQAARWRHGRWHHGAVAREANSRLSIEIYSPSIHWGVNQLYGCRFMYATANKLALTKLCIAIQFFYRGIDCLMSLPTFICKLMFTWNCNVAPSEGELHTKL